MVLRNFDYTAFFADNLLINYSIYKDFCRDKCDSYYRKIGNKFLQQKEFSTFYSKRDSTIVALSRNN